MRLTTFASALAILSFALLVLVVVLPLLVPATILRIGSEWPETAVVLLLHAVALRVVLLGWERGRGRFAIAAAVTVGVGSLAIWTMVIMVGGRWDAPGAFAAGAFASAVAGGLGLAAITLAARPLRAAGRPAVRASIALRLVAAALGVAAGAVLGGGTAAAVLADADGARPVVLLDETMRWSAVLLLLHLPLAAAAWVVDRRERLVVADGGSGRGTFRTRVACPRCGTAGELTSGEDHCRACGLIVRMGRA